MMPYGVKANVSAPHRFLRFGALCWMHMPNPGGGNDRFRVYGMSRGGRMVIAWVDARDLSNYRAGWFRDGELRWACRDRADAEAWAVAGNHHAANGVRPHAAAFGRAQP